MNPVPERWETGTQSFEALAGTVACIRYLASLSGEAFDRPAIVQSMNCIDHHEQQLSEQFLSGIKKLEGIKLYGIPNSSGRTSTFGITTDKLAPVEIATQLAKQDIFCWSGNFYAQELIRSLKLNDRGGLLRIGFVHYHGEEDVSRVLRALDTIT